MITPKKLKQLHDWMSALSIREEDLDETFILGSGSGGQKVNKTNSCVSLKHLPSGIVIKCQQERSREMNRYYARQRLCEKIDFLKQQEKSRREQAREKIRRQKKRRTRRMKENMLENKRRQAKLKKTRSKQYISTEPRT